MIPTRQGAVRLCWGLAAFDLILGTTAALFPAYYMLCLHPDAPVAHIDLARRAGMIWLGFAAVAVTAAHTRGPAQARWMLVLAVLRMMEVPADLIYAYVAEGSRWYGHLMLYSSPILNTVIGLYLYGVSAQIVRRHDAAALAAELAAAELHLDDRDLS